MLGLPVPRMYGDSTASSSPDSAKKTFDIRSNISLLHNTPLNSAVVLCNFKNDCVHWPRWRRLFFRNVTARVNETSLSDPHFLPPAIATDHPVLLPSIELGRD